jgi:hypothetical protein
MFMLWTTMISAQVRNNGIESAAECLDDAAVIHDVDLFIL